MKTMLTVIIACVLFSVPNDLSAQDRTEPVHFQRFGEAHKFIFFSVLEGLYEDGVTQDEIERILMKREGHGYEHFIYSCPICTGVLQAARLYAARPRFHSFKPTPADEHQVENGTFGSGLSAEVRLALASEKVEIRLEAIHGLVWKWSDRRLKRLDLSHEEETELLAEIDAGREAGMSALRHWQEDPDESLMKSYAPGYVELKGCAMCNAACKVEFDQVLDNADGEQERGP